jgi:hypothetical protein
MVLSRGLDSANSQPEFVKELESIMRQQNPGSDYHPVDGFFPDEKERRNNNGETNGRIYRAKLVLGDVRMTNAKVRKVIQVFELIVNACVSG